MKTITSSSRVLCLLASLVAPPAWAGAREEVNASMEKFMAARSYHASMTATGAHAMSNEVDYVAPGRYRMRMAGMGEQTIVGDTMYLNMHGKNTKVPLPKGTLSQWRDPARLAENAKTMTVTALGSEVLGGAPARKYRVDHSQPQPSTMTLWVGSNGYPLRIVTSTRIQGKPMITTIVYSRYDDPALRVDVPR